MPNIVSSASLQDLQTKAAVRGSATESVGENTFANPKRDLTTSAITPDYGQITTVGSFAVKCVSGSDVLVSLDGGSNYLLRVKPGNATVLRLNIEDLVETQTVQTVADVSDSLDGTYFTLEGNSGTWAIWIDTDDSGTAEPSHGQDSSVEVTGIATDATAAQVAAAINTALSADTAFLADFDVAYDAATDDDLITITDKHAGTRTDIADTGSTGFTLTTTQQGAANTSANIRLKSAGTSVCQYGAAPY